MTRADTAQRGLEHWSEAGRAEMEAFYSLAVEDYRQLVQAADWPGLLGSHAHDDWRLLDVACGSGKFPAALLRDADLSTLPPLPVDLLDPSAFSVAEAKGVLALPFVAGRELVVTLQDLPADLPPYDVVWATHALYALPVTSCPPRPSGSCRRSLPAGSASWRRRPRPLTTWPSTTPLGPLSFARGRDLRTLVDDLGFDKVGTTYDVEAARRFAAAAVLVEDGPYDVGEVSFHSALCFHTAGPNRTTQPRRALATTYLADGVRVVDRPTMVSGAWRDFLPGVEPGGLAASRLNPVVGRRDSSRSG